MPKHKLNIAIPLPADHPLCEAHREFGAAVDSSHIDLVAPKEYAIDLLDIDIDIDFPDLISVEVGLVGLQPIINKIIQEELARHPLTDPVNFSIPTSTQTSVQATSGNAQQIQALRTAIMQRIDNEVSNCTASSPANVSVTLATAKANSGMGRIFGDKHKAITPKDVGSVASLVSAKSNPADTHLTTVELRSEGQALSVANTQPHTIPDEISMETLKGMLGDNYNVAITGKKDDGGGPGDQTIHITTKVPPVKSVGTMNIVNKDGVNSLVITAGDFGMDYCKGIIENTIFNSKSPELPAPQSPTFTDSIDAIVVPTIPEQEGTKAQVIASGSMNPMFKAAHAAPTATKIYDEHKAKFEALYAAMESRYTDKCDTIQTQYKSDCTAALIGHLTSGDNEKFTIDNGELKFDGKTIGAIALDVSNDPAFTITPNAESAAICTQFRNTASKMDPLTYDKIKPPTKPDLPEFTQPAPAFPLGQHGDPMEFMAKLCEAYSQKYDGDGQASEFRIKIDDKGYHLMENGVFVSDITFGMKASAADGTKQPHFYLSNPRILTEDMQALSTEFGQHIANNDTLKRLLAPKETIATPKVASISIDIGEHPKLSVPDAPQISDELRTNADYVSSHDAAFASHLGACEQSHKEQIQNSIHAQLLKAVEGAIPSGKGSFDIVDGALMLNRSGHEPEKIGSIDTVLDGGKWKVNIEPEPNKANLCRVFNLKANEMQFKPPEITLPKFKPPAPPKSPTVEVEMGGSSPAPNPDQDEFNLQAGNTMTFARARAGRLSQKADTAKIVALKSEGLLKADDWSKVSESFVEHMNGLKDKEAAYAKQNASPDYIKAYQEEGKNFYQGMNIEMVSGSHIRITGTDIAEGDKPYSIDIHHNPSTGVVITRMDSPPTDKQLLCNVEFMKQAALKTNNKNVTITEYGEFDDIKRTIGMINSQGLVAEVTPMIEEAIKKHIKAEMEADGENPRYAEIKEEFANFMASRFAGIDPATKPPPPPPKPPADKPATDKPPTDKPPESTPKVSGHKNR